MTIRKIKFAWKYRKPLWKYRKLIARRREIAGTALAGAAILGLVMLKRATNRSREREEAEALKPATV